MTTDEIRKLLQVRPFRPFQVHMPSGNTVAVRHPEMLSFSRGGRTAAIDTGNDAIDIVDVLLVERLSVLPRVQSGVRTS